jgi:HTH-type transcriptional regulator/antitoxin HigA
MNARAPAEIFPPGEFLREELEARNWTQQELAEILDRPPRLISELLAAKRAVTPETAQGLAQAFGTSAEYWLNLESQYQLSKLGARTDYVERKALLYSKFPVREMLRRGWIAAATNLDVLEQNFCEFFRISNPSEVPSFAHSARKTDALAAPTMLQLAWLFRVRAMADRQLLAPYAPEVLERAVTHLKALRTAPEEARRVPRILADAGVRFVVAEQMPGSKIDGACFWLDDSKPVIGMSLRHDRIDNFWFVLRHEIEHVLREDGKGTSEPIVDSDVGVASEELPEIEARANSAAAHFCVEASQLDDFVLRVNPFFSEQKIAAFAARIGVHPGIVVGQLHRKLGRFDFLRRHQVKVRAHILPSADVDGWGYISS